MDILKKLILPIGVICCGTFLATNAYDQALTSRHIIWCILTLVLVVSTKEIRIGVAHIFIIGYLLFAIFSGAFAVNKSEWLYSVLRIVLMVSYLSVVVVDKKFLAKAMVLLGTFFIFWFWYEYSQVGIFSECRGLMRQRNTWAAAQFFMIPFCYYLLILKETTCLQVNGTHLLTSDPWKDVCSEYRWKFLAFVILVSMVVNIILLGSRSVILAVVVSAGIIMLTNKKLRPYVFAIGLIGVVILYFKGGQILSTESLQHRLAQWRPTLSLIANNPWGVGVGNWWIIFPSYAPAIAYPDAFVLWMFRHPHNDFLWVCSEVGILGFLCYLGIFITALYYACKKKAVYLVIAIVGYMVIASFSTMRERAFTSLLLMTFIAMTCKGKMIEGRHILIPVLIFALIVFGFRFKASCWNKTLRRGCKTEEIMRGFSAFSTLTYVGLPYHWWNGMMELQENKQLAITDLKRAYEYNPYNVHVLNGMGVASGLEKNYFMAKLYFNEALRICPDFKDAKDNLKVLNEKQKNRPGS